jgi:hypothetical protein
MPIESRVIALSEASAENFWLDFRERMIPPGAPEHIVDRFKETYYSAMGTGISLALRMHEGDIPDGPKILLRVFSEILEVAKQQDGITTQ